MSGAQVSTSASKAAFMDAVRAELQRNKKITAWQVASGRRAGLQTYLVKTQVESERRVEDEAYQITVFVKHDDVLGRAAINVVPGDRANLTKRIDDAVYMAGLGGDAPWELPKSGPWPQVDAFDPALSAAQVRATSKALADTWAATVKAHPEARASSMELFCSEHHGRLENSSGLIAESQDTRVSLLTLLLADGAKPSERYSWDERRRVQDLDVQAIVSRAATEAHDLTSAAPPPSGQMAVIIDAEEIANFLSPISDNSSAEGLYSKSSRFEVGKPLPIETKGGEPLTVISNALTPYGLTSYAYDGNGVAGQRIEIVKDGVFMRPWATKQYADYLKTAPTGGFANLEVPAGKTPLAELTANGPVLYVRTFSWLTPEGQRGNFGSEIRVGYLYDKGKRTPIKGGSVSGNVFAALGTAKYSKETVFRGDYVGPVAVRLDGLVVSGT